MKVSVGLHREKVKAAPAVVIQLTAYINRKMNTHTHICISKNFSDTQLQYGSWKFVS